VDKIEVAVATAIRACGGLRDAVSFQVKLTAKS
jgi:hypothetical protein